MTAEILPQVPLEERYITSLSEVGKADVAVVGGKAANLGEMIRNGVNVPPGFAVTTKAYREFMETNGLYETISSIISNVNVNDSEKLRLAAQEIQKAIIDAPMPEATRRAIQEAYRTMGDVLVAARSSATAEDLEAASFAGQQRTALNVLGAEEVVLAVQSCWASLFEARAIFYREANGFGHEEVAISVAVQEMVASEVSGVMFTAEPITYDPDTILIEAIYGLGEPIVSGQLSPDSYLVTKSGPTIIKRDIVAQPWLLANNSDGLGQTQGTIEVEVPGSKQTSQKLKDGHIIELARQGVLLERIYGGQPQDVEWALSHDVVYIVQTRAITALRKPAPRLALAAEALEVVIEGAPASPGVSAGKVTIIGSSDELHLVKDGDILVSDVTTPDFVPAMKRAAGIVTNRGGRTCHAAIVSREMGVPCVVGATDATRVLHDVPIVTVDGTAGKVYSGDVAHAFSSEEDAPKEQESFETHTRLYVNLADPDSAERVSKMAVDGVGLLRAEFIVAHIGEHPRAMLETGRGGEFIDRLSQDLTAFTSAFYPRPVVYRFSDFKTNEYRNLKGGEAYEPYEENPMLGYRGCSRYLAEKDLFDLEVRAIKKVRESYSNLWVMLPFVRTVNELREVKALLEELGLRQTDDFKLWMMLEVPSNVLLLDDFLDVGVDGVSIGSNDLTQLMLGVDRDNQKLASLFDERDPAVLLALETIIRRCAERGVTCSICGQAPSEYPELTRKLVEWGITSVSVSPDMIKKARVIIHEAENQENLIAV